MSPEMEDVIIEKPIKIRKESFIDVIKHWFISKGWVYLMVFIMGILLGGLIWK